jgi:hypothetical protein
LVPGAALVSELALEPALVEVPELAPVSSAVAPGLLALAQT